MRNLSGPRVNTRLVSVLIPAGLLLIGHTSIALEKQQEVEMVRFYRPSLECPFRYFDYR